MRVESEDITPPEQCFHVGTVFRVVYDVVLKGLPEEISCLARLGEQLFASGSCVGTHTSFLCSYRGCLVKVAPQIVKPAQITYELLQAGSVKVVVESTDHTSLVQVVSDVYRVLKDCGLTLRLLPD